MEIWNFVSPKKSEPWTSNCVDLELMIKLSDLLNSWM